MGHGASARHDRVRGRSPVVASWMDTGWPVAGGVATAVGLVGCVRLYGPLGATLLFLLLWAFFALVCFSVVMESRMSGARAVRLGLVASHTLLVLVGLLELFPSGGWVPVVVLAATSPPVVERATRRRMTQSRRPASTDRPRREERDRQAAVDRAFAEIVARLTDQGRSRKDRS